MTNREYMINLLLLSIEKCCIFRIFINFVKAV